MKKLIFLIAMVSWTLVSSGQSNDSALIQTFGIKGGSLVSNLSPNSNYAYRLSYQGGFVFELQLGKSHNLLTEFMFSNEGYGSKRDGFWFYNIVFPLLYKYHFNDWLAVELGPQWTVNIGTNRRSRRVDYPSSVNVCFGLSTSITDHNYVNVRYARGVTPIMATPDLFSSVITFSLINEF